MPTPEDDGERLISRGERLVERPGRFDREEIVSVSHPDPDPRTEDKSATALCIP